MSLLSAHPTNTRFKWFWVFVTSCLFIDYSSFHLYDQVVKQSLFHLDLEDSFTKAVMQIGLKYGQTVFEVNRVIGGRLQQREGAQREHKWDMDQSKTALCVEYQLVDIMPTTVCVMDLDYIIFWGSKPVIALMFWEPTNHCGLKSGPRNFSNFFFLDLRLGFRFKV